ncbi:MAG: TraR/DksA C4-type zinc finger protein [Puniceicoccales bacterium]|jgi:RNA polymerase-binding transcription factor DksA|nr:TraR/DksA C4-type zinc finger protein [Puniceicoccales bacterium]
MSVLENIDQISQNETKNKHFPRIRKNDDSVFSIDDARELIKAKNETDETENQEEVIGKKKDIIAQQINTPTPQKVGTASIADIFGFDPTHSAQTNSRDKNPDEVPQKYRKYYKLLLKLKNDLKKDLSKLTADNLAISVGDTKQDPVDHEIESFDSEFAITLMSNEQEALTEVEEAIQRIYDGTYGICELTGKPIEPQRLLAVPFARFSIEGQMEKEKEKNKPVEASSGSIFQIDQSTDELADFETKDDE